MLRRSPSSIKKLTHRLFLAKMPNLDTLAIRVNVVYIYYPPANEVVLLFCFSSYFLRLSLICSWDYSKVLFALLAINPLFSLVPIEVSP